MAYYLGIDPGVTGAFALYSSPNDYHVFDWNRERVTENLKTLEKFKLEVALIEKITAMPGQNSKSGATQFRNLGHWDFVLEELGVPIYRVTPKNWRKHAGITLPDHSELKKTLHKKEKGKPLTKDQRKENSKINSVIKREQKQFLLTLGKERFPKATINLIKHTDRAEALLMAYACFILHKGE